MKRLSSVDFGPYNYFSNIIYASAYIEVGYKRLWLESRINFFIDWDEEYDK